MLVVKIPVLEELAFRKAEALPGTRSLNQHRPARWNSSSKMGRDQR